MPHAGIAVVNTDLRLLELLRELLTDVGYDVAIYLTTEDTYQHVRQTQPKLIVLDVGMQGAVAGWPLLTVLRLDPQTTHIPILVTTLDHPLAVDKMALLQAHGCDILELPIGFETLHARVEKLLTIA